jgi:hypothetical protein
VARGLLGQHLDDQATREVDDGGAERVLAARKVMVERSLGGAALGHDLLQSRRREALLAEEPHGGADEILLVRGGAAHRACPFLQL